jgi:hypothetical protein
MVEERGGIGERSKIQNTKEKKKNHQSRNKLEIKINKTNYKLNLY